MVKILPKLQNSLGNIFVTWLGRSRDRQRQRCRSSLIISDCANKLCGDFFVSDCECEECQAPTMLYHMTAVIQTSTKETVFLSLNFEDINPKRPTDRVSTTTFPTRFNRWVHSFCFATESRTSYFGSEKNSGANWIKHMSLSGLCIGIRPCYFVLIQLIMNTKLMSSLSLSPSFSFKCFSSGSIIYHHYSLYVIYNMMYPGTFINV